MTGDRKEFQTELLQIAVPVTLQCLMQSSFSVVDQIMTGQLGSISIAGIGLGGKGAAWASVIAQLSGCIITVILFFHLYQKHSWRIPFVSRTDKVHIKQYMVVLMPLLICEFFWSLGENIYASIYGHVGTNAFAAMTLTNPLQALVMGALSGVSQAARVMIGKRLGADDTGSAYQDSKRLMYTGIACSVLLSVFVIVFHKYYVLIFKVEDDVRQITGYLLIAYAFVAPVKVQNMILGGILRSGGRTTYVMAVDLIDTWIFGVPLGVFSAFVLHLPIAAIYFVLSMEECVRVVIPLAIFRKKNWMQKL